MAQPNEPNAEGGGKKVEGVRQRADRIAMMNHGISSGKGGKTVTRSGMKAIAHCMQSV